MSAQPEGVSAAGELHRGEALLDAGRPELAVDHLRRAIAAEPEDDRAWCLLALACLRTEDTAGALGAANHAVRLVPDSDWPHRLACIALVRLGQPLEAVRAADAAVVRAPDLWAGHVQRAVALRAAGQLNDALAAAWQGVQLAPHESEAHTELGRVLLAQGRSADAEKALRMALEQDPADAVARHELARTQLVQRRYADAMAGFGSALRDDPTMAPARRNIDLTVRIAVSRATLVTALLCFVVARIVAALADGSTAADGLGNLRWGVAAAACAVAGVSAFLLLRTWRPLPPELRRVAVRAVRADHWLLAAVGCLAIAVLVLLSAAVVPDDAVAGVAVAAAVVALGGRLLLFGVGGVRWRWLGSRKG